MFNFLTSIHAQSVWDIGILEFGVQLPRPVYIIFTKHVVKKSKRTTWGIGDLVEKSNTKKVIS